jgi:hypothetical protein
VRFSFEWGGVMCEECSIADRNSAAVSSATIETFIRLMRLPLSDIVALDVIARLEDDLYLIVRDYVNYYIESKLKSRDYLGHFTYN